MSTSNTIAVIVSCITICTVVVVSFFIYKKGIRLNNIKLYACAFKDPILGVWKSVDNVTITIKPLLKNYIITSMSGSMTVKLDSNGIITTVIPNSNTFSDNIIGKFNHLLDGSYSVSLVSKSTRSHCTVCPVTDTTYIKSECLP